MNELACKAWDESVVNGSRVTWVPWLVLPFDTPAFGGGLDYWKAGCSVVGLTETVSISTLVISDHGNIAAVEEAELFVGKELNMFVGMEALLGSAFDGGS